MSVEFEPLEAFSTFDDEGQAREVEVWAEVTYSTNDSGQRVRSVGMKHLRLAESGNVVLSHLDGSLEDSKTGLRLRMGSIENGYTQPLIAALALSASKSI